jgi:hypothetical protein
VALQRRRGQRLVTCIDHARRVDRGDALGEHRDLGAAEAAVEGVQLAVDVGRCDVVGIDQAQPADPAARQRLDGIASAPARP